MLETDKDGKAVAADLLSGCTIGWIGTATPWRKPARTRSPSARRKGDG